MTSHLADAFQALPVSVSKCPVNHYHKDKLLRLLDAHPASALARLQ